METQISSAYSSNLATGACSNAYEFGPKFQNPLPSVYSECLHLVSLVEDLRPNILCIYSELANKSSVNFLTRLNINGLIR
jgi:hypothetical protein